MKKQFQFLLNIVLLMVFFSTTATTSFSYFPQIDQTAEKGEQVKSKEHSKFIFSEEIEEIQLPSKSEIEAEFSSHFFLSNSGSFGVFRSKMVAQAPSRCLDLKSFLKDKIFPFHTFW